MREHRNLRSLQQAQERLAWVYRQVGFQPDAEWRVGPDSRIADYKSREQGRAAEKNPREPVVQDLVRVRTPNTSRVVGHAGEGADECADRRGNVFTGILTAVGIEAAAVLVACVLWFGVVSLIHN